MLNVVFLLVSILNVFSNSALTVEPSLDYQSLSTSDRQLGFRTVLASKPIIGLAASFSMKIKGQLGFRLKYKKQKSDYIAPRSKSLSGNGKDLQVISIEFPYQFNNYLKSFVRYQNQDRLFLLISDADIFSLEKISTHNFGFGVQLESPSRIGFGWGVDVWGALISIPDANSKSNLPKEGIESGLSFKTTFNQKKETGYFVKCSYIKSDFLGNHSDFVFKELSYSAGVVWRFGNSF